MRLEVITPERIVFQDEVEEVTIPTTEGEITVLKHHIPLVAGIKAGAARVKKGGSEYFLSLSGGFAQVEANGRVIILSDTAERAEELDLAKIEESYRDAEALLKEKRALSDVEYAALAGAMERELARLKVARKARHGHDAGTVPGKSL